MAAPTPPRSPIAGGSLIALGAVLGTGVGLFNALGPVRGFLIGLSAGAALALAIWLNDLRRKF